VRSLTREQFLKIFGLSSGAFDAQQRAGHVALAFGTPSPAMPGRYCDLDLTALAIAAALAPTLGRPTATTIVLGFFNPCLSGLHTHPPVLVFFHNRALAIGADVLDAIV